MTSHIQRLYAKIQANRLNNKAFREHVKQDDKLITLILFGVIIFDYIILAIIWKMK